MKNLTKILLISPLFFISSCEEEGPIHGCLDSQALNYNPEASINNNSCEYFELGAITEGGIVFYIDETGQHGLVAALEDLTEGNANLEFGGYGCQWGCYNENVEGADGTAIGTGYQNTMDIVNQGCETENGDITAAQAALDAEINGYSDWYLPSKDELEEMYITIGNGGIEGNIGGLNYSYWSSSEFGINFAWSVVMDDSFNQDYTMDAKYSNYRVRVIRAF